jgi:hypothetical protein
MIRMKAKVGDLIFGFAANKLKRNCEQAWNKGSDAISMIFTAA